MKTMSCECFSSCCLLYFVGLINFQLNKFMFLQYILTFVDFRRPLISELRQLKSSSFCIRIAKNGCTSSFLINFAAFIRHLTISIMISDMHKILLLKNLKNIDFFCDRYNIHKFSNLCSLSY